MNRVVLALACLLGCQPAASRPTADRLGSILGTVSTKAGTTCLAIENPGLRPGARLTVVYPGPPSAIVTAQVADPDAACARDRPMIGYALHPVRGSSPPAAPGVGEWVAESAIGTRKRVAELRAPGQRKPIQLRACTSA